MSNGKTKRKRSRITLADVTRNEISTDEVRARLREGKPSFKVTYLPFSGAPFDKNEHGRTERFYADRDEAQRIFDGVVDSGWVEEAELRRVLGDYLGATRLEDEWDDRKSTPQTNPQSRSHKDVEFAVDDYQGNEKIFKRFDEAAAFAVEKAMTRGETVRLDMLVSSRAGAKWLYGDDGVEMYEEDPEASVFERIEIRATTIGRVP